MNDVDAETAAIHVVGFSVGDNQAMALQHSPDSFHVFRSESPVALAVKISEIELGLQPVKNSGDGAGHFATHKNFAPSGRFVIEENSVYSKKAVAFAGVYGHPVAVDFCASVRAARTKRGFVLRALIRLAVHFAAGRVVQPCGNSSFTDGVEQAGRSERGDVAGVFRDVETHADVTLRAEVINLIGGDAVKQLGEAAGVGKIREVHEEFRVAFVPVGE
jgi:hypothetical protein